MLFRPLWLLIYLTTARWCFEIVCPCAHSLTMDLCLFHGSPRFFIKSHQRMISIALNLETQTMVEVVCCSSPQCFVLSPPHRLFIHHNHFAIISSLPCSSCHFWFKHCGCSRESSHMWEDADSKYLCPFLVLMCASSSVLRCISAPSLHNKGSCHGVSKQFFSLLPSSVM